MPLPKLSRSRAKRGRAVFLLSLLIAVARAVDAPAAEAKDAPSHGASGLDLDTRDLSVKPGDDFNLYAGGKWLRRVKIPADETDAGPFTEIANRTLERLRLICEECAREPANPTARKIGDLYSAFMDEKRIEKLGATPLQSDLRAIRDLPDKEALAQRMGESQSVYGKGLFVAYIKVDAKNPEQHVLRLDQAGLSLSDREMYLNDDFKKLRAAYRDYARRTLQLVGWPDAKKAADDVLALETRVAEARWTMTESGDRAKIYNPMSVAELERLAPSFPWRAYLRGAGVEGLEHVVVAQKTAFPKIADIFRDTPLETLKAWEALQMVDEASQYLSKQYVDNRFSFRGKAEQGLERDQVRWKRAVALLNIAIDKGVGREYVARHFPPEAKAKMEALVADLKSAMAKRIERLEWMAPETKSAALEKLQRLRVMVGYPDEWRDYSGLSIQRDDLYGSVKATKAFEWSWQSAKLTRPVDRAEWWEPPQMVDAYADYSRIHIVFPAGILQPPFFDPEADQAAIYGAIGTVVGHEITHQFDSQGRKFDATGALRDWWTAEDAARFEQSAARLVTQFDSYEAYPGIHQNGKLTLSENIADLGGLLIALDAYHASLRGQPAPEIEGTTGEQRVFLGWAMFLRTKTREDLDKQLAVSSVHALPRFRIIGSMRNVDAWYDAFGVKLGDRNYLEPQDRVRIW